MKKRRIIAVLTMALIAASFLAAAGTTETATTEKEGETRVWTDSLGRVKELPYPVTRISPSGNLAQMTIYALCPETLVGLARPLSANAMEFMLPEIRELPAFGNFYGKNADFNKEAVMMARPQVLIDVGEVSSTMNEDLDTLEEQTGIPVFFVEGFLDNIGDTVREIGKLTGLDERAEVLASYAERITEKARMNRDLMEEPVTVYYSSSRDGLNAFPKKSFHGEILDFMGFENVVPEGFSAAGNQISMEQMMLWDPEHMFIQNREAYETITHDERWSGLSAVKNGNVHLIPILPYPFLSNPPALNRLMGMIWLGKICAPELWSDMDMEEEMKTFYSLFYHYELTDEEISSILEK